MEHADSVRAGNYMKHTAAPLEREARCADTAWYGVVRVNKLLKELVLGSADCLQGVAVRDHHGRTLNRDQMLALELTQSASDRFARCTDALRHLFVRQRYLGSGALGGFFTF